MAAIIYTIDENRKIYFGLSRKAPTNSKVGPAVVNTGASGTDEKYHGKWGSFGGKKAGRSKSDYHGALIELYDEAGFRTRCLELNNSIYELKSSTIHHGVSIFLIYMKYYNIFFNYFPKLVNKGLLSPLLLNDSHGEIDAICSMNFEEMCKYQEETKVKEGNNFFLSYFVESFKDFILKELIFHHRCVKDQFDLPFDAIPDTKGRDFNDIDELRLGKYKKERDRTYKFDF